MLGFVMDAGYPEILILPQVVNGNLLIELALVISLLLYLVSHKGWVFILKVLPSSPDI